MFLASGEPLDSIISLKMRIDPLLPAGKANVYKYLVQIFGERVGCQLILYKESR